MPDQDQTGFSRVCPSCGRRVPRNVTTCRCGVELPAETISAAPAAMPEESSGGSSTLIALVVAVLLIGGAGYWFFVAPRAGGHADGGGGRRRLHARSHRRDRARRITHCTRLGCDRERQRDHTRGSRADCAAGGGAGRSNAALGIDGRNGRSRDAGGGADRNDRRPRQRLLRASRHVDHERARRGERPLRDAAAHRRHRP